MAAGYSQLFDPEVSRPRVHKIANKSTKTKARSSLPDILSLKIVDGRIGVFTTCSLAQATQFGPLEAPLVRKNQMEDTNFLMKLDIKKCRRLDYGDVSYIYYDTSDENMCNWMMLVYPAKYYVEQNLCAHQVEDFIFYTATREISANEELKVWYSPSYAKFMSTAVLTPTSGIVAAPKITINKAKKLKSSRRMQVYPNSMISEMDERSVPPKKRGWRKTKEKQTDDVDSFDKHFAELEGKGKKVFTCPICRRSFKTKYKLQIHSVTHSDARNFLCHICGAAFKRKDKLHDHMGNLHRGGKISRRKKLITPVTVEKYNFNCTYCKIGFQRRGMFINHLIKRHPETQTNTVKELDRPILKTVREFHCPHCDKVYRSSTKRKLHVLKQHPGKQMPASIKNVRCTSGGNDGTIIDKETVTADPACCPYCDRQYSTKHKRNKHVKDKHGDKLKDCNRQPSHNHLSHVCDVDNPLLSDVSPSILRDPPQNHRVSDIYTDPMSVNNSDQNNPYCTPSRNPQTFRNELNSAERDVMNIAMTDFEPASSRGHLENFTELQTPPRKESTYSRYPVGRKSMLLRYEDSQNQMAHNTPEVSHPGKQMPYKDRVLSNDRRVWRDGHELHAITEIPQDQAEDQTYSNLNTATQSIVSMLGPDSTEDAMLLNDRPTSHAAVLSEHDVTELVDGYPNSGSSNWIYQSMGV